MSISRTLYVLVRPYTWVSRFRHRRGYGVHSPFAFNFITRVIFERAAYYKYAELRALEKRQRQEKGAAWLYEPLRVKRLLFRLVNFSQPGTVVDAGRLAASSLYLKAGCERAVYLGAADLSELFLEAGEPVDFLYLHDYRRPDFVEQVFQVCVSRATARSLFVVEGICYSRPMKKLWRQMQADARVGITFDLYDLGILFFDKSKAKQDYIVNF